MEITLKEIEDAIRKAELDKIIEPLGNGLFRIGNTIVCDKAYLEDLTSEIKIVDFDSNLMPKKVKK